MMSESIIIIVTMKIRIGTWIVPIAPGMMNTGTTITTVIGIATVATGLFGTIIICLSRAPTLTSRFVKQLG